MGLLICNQPLQQLSHVPKRCRKPRLENAGEEQALFVEVGASALPSKGLWRFPFVLVMRASSGPWLNSRMCHSPHQKLWRQFARPLLNDAVRGAALAFRPPALWMRWGPTSRTLQREAGFFLKRMEECIAPGEAQGTQAGNMRFANSQAKTLFGQQQGCVPSRGTTASLPEWLRGWT